MNLNNKSDLHHAWYSRVVPLLEEYFYNDGERLHAHCLVFDRNGVFNHAWIMCKTASRGEEPSF